MSLTSTLIVSMAPLARDVLFFRSWSRTSVPYRYSLPQTDNTCCILLLIYILYFQFLNLCLLSVAYCLFIHKKRKGCCEQHQWRGEKILYSQLTSYQLTFGCFVEQDKPAVIYVFSVEDVFCAQGLASVVTDLAETCRSPPGPVGSSIVKWSPVN